MVSGGAAERGAGGCGALGEAVRRHLQGQRAFGATGGRGQR